MAVKNSTTKNKITPSEIEKTIENIKAFSDSNDERQSKNIVGNTRKYPLVNVNLGELNLTGIIFKNISLDGVNFKNTNLENAQFIRASLKNVTFSSVNLNNAYFEKTNIQIEQLQQCKSIENIDGLSEDMISELQKTTPHLMGWYNPDLLSFFAQIFGDKCKKWPTKMSQSVGSDPWNNGYTYCYGLKNVLQGLRKTPQTTEEIVRNQLDDTDIIHLMEKEMREGIYQRMLEGFSNYNAEMAAILSGKKNTNISLAKALNKNDKLITIAKNNIPKNDIPKDIWEQAEKKAFYYLYRSLKEQYIKFNKDNDYWYIRGRGFYLFRSNYFYIR